MPRTARPSGLEEIKQSILSTIAGDIDQLIAAVRFQATTEVQQKILASLPGAGGEGLVVKRGPGRPRKNPENFAGPALGGEAPQKKRKYVTAEQREMSHLRGRYMGLGNSLPKKIRKQAKEIKNSDGLAKAVDFLEAAKAGMVPKVAKTAKTVKAGRPAKATKAAKPAKVAKAAKVAKPAKAAKSAKVAKPTKVAKPAKIAKPTKVAKVAAKPVKGAKPVKAKKASKSAGRGKTVDEALAGVMTSDRQDDFSATWP